MTCERILVLTGPRPDATGTPEQRRLHAVVDAAARRWPEARWTVGSLDGEPVTRPDAMGDAGIEAVTAVIRGTHGSPVAGTTTASSPWLIHAGRPVSSGRIWKPRSPRRREFP